MWCIAAATVIMDCSNRMGSEYDKRLKAVIVYEFFAGLRPDAHFVPRAATETTRRAASPQTIPPPRVSGKSI